MHGGNVEQALAKALRDNNRLAALYRENPEAFRAGAVADPSLPPEVDAASLFVEPPPETPSFEPPELDENAIRVAVNERVYQEPVTVDLINRYMSNKAQIEGHPGNPATGIPPVQGLVPQIIELQQRVQYESMKLNDSDFAPDDLRKGEIEQRLMRMQTQLGLLQQERSRLLFENQGLNQDFRSQRAQIEAAVRAAYEAQAGEEAQTAYESHLEESEYRTSLTEWPVAVQRAIQDAQIPPALAAQFSDDALTVWEAALARDQPVDDLRGFVGNYAKQWMARADEFHRFRAGQYGAAAAARAATPSPPTAPGSPAPPAAPQATPEAAIDDARRYLKGRLGAVR